MYKKYFHSKDRKVNLLPITEGFFSNIFRSREDKLAEELRKRTEFRLTYSKYDPETMYNKTQAIIKKILSKSEFKDLKKIAKPIVYKSHSESEIKDFSNFGYGYGTNGWGDSDYIFTIYQFDFGKEVTSSQEGKYRSGLLSSLIKIINKEIEKIDDTYSCSLYDPGANDDIDNHWSSTVFICLDSEVYMFDDKEWKK